MGFDPTPGFSLGISKKVNQGNTGFKGSSQNTVYSNNPTVVDNSSSPFSSLSQQMWQGVQGQTKGLQGADMTPQNDTMSGGNSKYSQWGGESGYNSAVSGFDTQKQNVYGSARDAAQNAFSNTKGSILDFIQSMQSGQRALDERGVQNELGLRQGRSSILDMVGQGIRSGGTMLANRNAGDSSAVEGLSRAYGRMGQQQMGQINNQYELENRDIGLAQSEFDEGRTSGMRRFDQDKMNVVNNIVTNARNQLAQIDAQIAAADLPNRVNLEQEKNNIKNEVMNILSGLDQEMSQGMSGITPAGMDANRRTAADLATRGVAAASPFDFTAEVPAQFAGTGPFAAELPLFMGRGRRQEA